MFHVTGVWENKVLSAVCLLFGCALPFLNVEQTRSWLVCGEAVFALALFGILLFYHESLHYTKAATAFAATSAIAYTTSVLIWLRQMSETALIGIYYTLLAFGLAWLTDTGAYLFGITMGKHKLAPKISQWAAWCSVLPQCFCYRSFISGSAAVFGAFRFRLITGGFCCWCQLVL